MTIGRASSSMRLIDPRCHQECTQTVLNFRTKPAECRCFWSEDTVYWWTDQSRVWDWSMAELTTIDSCDCALYEELSSLEDAGISNCYGAVLQCWLRCGCSPVGLPRSVDDHHVLAGSLANGSELSGQLRAVIERVARFQFMH